MAGELRSGPSETSCDARLVADGITFRALEPYLKAAGVEPVLERGSISCEGTVVLAPQRDETTLATIELRSLVYADREELCRLRTVRLSELRLDATPSAVHCKEIEVSGTEFELTRERGGALNLLGFRVLPSPDPPAAMEAAAEKLRPGAPETLPGNPEELRLFEVATKLAA